MIISLFLNNLIILVLLIVVYNCVPKIYCPARVSVGLDWWEIPLVFARLVVARRWLSGCQPRTTSLYQWLYSCRFCPDMMPYLLFFVSLPIDIKFVVNTFPMMGARSWESNTWVCRIHLDHWCWDDSTRWWGLYQTILRVRIHHRNITSTFIVLVRITLPIALGIHSLLLLLTFSSFLFWNGKYFICLNCGTNKTTRLFILNVQCILTSQGLLQT